MIKKYFGLLLLSFLLNCKTTSKLEFSRIGVLNGKWEFACTAPIKDPDNLECPDFENFEHIEVDPDSGNGKTIFRDGGRKVETTFKIFKEGKKLMITYYLAPEEMDVQGEILILNEKEFKVKFEKERIYTIQKRAGR